MPGESVKFTRGKTHKLTVVARLTPLVIERSPEAMAWLRKGLFTQLASKLSEQVEVDEPVSLVLKFQRGEEVIEGERGLVFRLTARVVFGPEV